MYKFFEIKKGQEEMIIADFNLDHKGAQVPIPSNPKKVIKSVDAIQKFQFNQIDQGSDASERRIP